MPPSSLGKNGLHRTTFGGARLPRTHALLLRLRSSGLRAMLSSSLAQLNGIDYALWLPWGANLLWYMCRPSASESREGQAATKSMPLNSNAGMLGYGHSLQCSDCKWLSPTTLHAGKCRGGELLDGIMNAARAAFASGEAPCNSKEHGLTQLDVAGGGLRLGKWERKSGGGDWVGSTGAMLACVRACAHARARTCLWCARARH